VTTNESPKNANEPPPLAYARAGDLVRGSRWQTLSRNRHLWLLAILLYAGFSHWYVWSRNVSRNADGKRDYATIRFSDEMHYYQRAADRFAEEGLTYLASEDSLRSPPMPWLWHYIWGRNVVLTRIINLCCVLLGAYLVGCVARRFDAQLLATFLTAVSYQAAYYSGTILTEPLAFFFVCLSLYCIHRACLERMRYGWMGLAGVFVALAVFSRPSLQPWPVGLLILVVLARILRFPRRTQLQVAGIEKDIEPTQRFKVRHAVLLLIISAAIQAPWLIKNANYFDAPRIANGLGAVLYLGAESKTNADEPGFSGMQWPNVAVQGPHGHMSLDGEQRLKDAAWKKIGDNLGAWVQLMPVKVLRVLFGGPRWHFQPGRTLHESKLWLGRTRGWVRYLWWTCFGTLVCVYGLIGLTQLSLKKEALGLAGAALVLTLLAVHVVTYAMPRFLVPAWPAIALGAAFAVKHLRWRSHLAAVGTALCVILTITTWHMGDASREVSASRRNAFTIAAEASFNQNAVGSLAVSCDGFKPRLNTCVFVSTRLQSSNRDLTSAIAQLVLEPDAEKSKSQMPKPIELELRVDGELHHYLQCIEFESAWRNSRWRQVKLVFPDDAPLDILEATISIGY